LVSSGPNAKNFSKPLETQTFNNNNPNYYNNTPYYSSNQPGSYAQSSVSYSTTNTPSSFTSSTNFPSSFNSNFSAMNTGTNSYNFPTMNFDTFKVDMPSINQNFSREFTIPKTNFTATTYVSPSSNYNFSSTNFGGINDNFSNKNNNNPNTNNSFSKFPNTTHVNPLDSTNNTTYKTYINGTTYPNNYSTTTFINSTATPISQPFIKRESKFISIKPNFEEPTTIIKTTQQDLGYFTGFAQNQTGNVFDNMNFKKFGSFVANQEQFEVNFIKEDVVINRLNVFNQLHRHNLKEEDKKAMDYAEAHELKIKNKSSTPFLLRLSGRSGEEILEFLYQGQTRSWMRVQNSVYKLNLTTSINLMGVTYNIKSGCKYEIDENNNLTDAGKNTLISTSKPYNPNFCMLNQFGIFFKKDDVTMRDLVSMDKSLIVVVNRGNDTVSVKIEGYSNLSFEDYIEIEPLIYAVFKRKEGASYVLTCNKIGLSETKKHFVASGNTYCFAEEFLGLCDDLSKKSVGIHIPEETQKKEVLNVYWEKIMNLLKNNTNKYKIKAFDTLLFAQVEVKNTSGADVYIRVKSRKIGSEEFFLIKSNETKSWKRFEGVYLAEIVALHDMNSRRFLLKTDTSNSVNSNLQLIDSLSYQPLRQEKETFETKQLVYFDNSQRIYLRKDIIYEVEIHTSSKKLEEEEKKAKEEENNNYRETGWIDKEEYEYFEGIKSDYTPGLQFIDAHFPPDQSTLKAVDPFTNIKRKPHFVHAKKGLSEQSINFLMFKRPNEAFKGQYYLFKDDICYDDVKQGQIGNCYLMSILAALSQRTDLIKAVFKTQTVNPDGYYELFYYENGEKKILFIDDNFVLMKSNFMKEFQFAQPNGEELWVMLIEKAYAKYEGGYSNILGGLMYPELQWLTGALTRELKTTDSQCWNEIYNACKAHHILVTGSLTGSGNHSNKTAKGISNGHAYSILDAKEYRKAGSESLRLMKIRNPWGHTEWTGDFCDNSPLWTPQLKAFFGFEEGAKDDGVFFMPFDDYNKEFKNIIICAIDSKN
jgi:hypothetical protein